MRITVGLFAKVHGFMNYTTLYISKDVLFLFMNQLILIKKTILPNLNISP